MTLANRCKYFGHYITIDKALAIRDATPSGRRKPLGFECVECGKAVRPYNAGDNCAAHFKHLSRNPQCKLSDPPRNY